jgi:hypothetical protein
LEVLIKAIEEEYGFNFTGSFFESQEFKQLYFNLQKDQNRNTNGSLIYHTDSGTVSIGSNTSWDLELKMNIQVNSNVGVPQFPFRIIVRNNGLKIYESEEIEFLSAGAIVNLNFSNIYEFNGVDYDYDYEVEITTENNYTFNSTVDLDYRYVGSGASASYTPLASDTYLNQLVPLEVVIQNQFKDIKVYDFLTSLFKMFNLIVRPDGTNIYIEDLQTWYSSGQIYDITKFVDTQTEQVNRGKIFKELSFKFEESEQILASQFKKSNNTGYGDLDFKLGTEEALEDIDGEVLDIEVLFENPIYERLWDTNTNIISDVQYCLYLSDELEQLEGNSFLFYANNNNISGHPISFLNGTSVDVINSAFLPSHSIEIDTPSFNVNFNAEVNEYTRGIFQNTIFKKYYQDYITDMFSIKRRVYNYDAILPINLLNNLKLNDRLIIKNRRYIINSITHDLVERKDKLELINDIFDAPLASDTLNTSLFTKKSVFTDFNSKTLSNTYVGVDGKTVSLVDTGDGITWVTGFTKTTVGTITTIEFTVLENTTEYERTMNVKVTDGLNDPEFRIYQNRESDYPSYRFYQSRNSQYIPLI